MSYSESNICKVIDAYAFPGELLSREAFGNGHINDTICLTYNVDGKIKKYVLQKINKYVFHHPDELMDNTVRVTEHIRKKVIADGGDSEREVLSVVLTADGRTFCTDDDDDYWRVTEFIENSESREAIDKPDDFYQTGLAFGHFQNQLSDFPAETLYETIPGFHNTRSRFDNFVKTVEEDPCGRADECREEINFILERKDLAYYAMNSYEKGELPLRVTHNDTKINNLMFDKTTGRPLCVIDLDTVMPGFAMYDFGDAIRTGANTGAEDEPDVSKIACDLELYEAFAKGFIEGCEGKLTGHEIDTLPMGALGITYEQALRFLEDYIKGDVYYKTAYAKHNLVRTHTQIKLVQDMENKWDEIQKIISKYK